MIDGFWIWVYNIGNLTKEGAMRRFFEGTLFKRILGVACTFVLAVCFFVVGVNLIVYNRTELKIVDADGAEAFEEPFDCILVLGAGVRADGSPSHMLEDRLEIGIEMYFAGASERLLMSGDHMSPDYNEVGVMKSHAMSAGVPAEVIFLDHAGLSTYESIWRAKEIFGAKRILVVTQKYHLYRALYVADALGLEAYGVSADLRPYTAQIVRDIREVAARVKDFILSYAQPQAQYVGDPIDLTGNAGVTDVNPWLEEK